MTRRPDKLSEDDRVLWNLVARTAKPLKGKFAVDIPEIPAEAKPSQSQPAQP
ncbi:DNA mismatch repair protein MutS, partial [Mesorhizobium sp. M7A.F.Ca.CA.002.03.2.1]